MLKDLLNYINKQKDHLGSYMVKTEYVDSGL